VNHSDGEGCTPPSLRGWRVGALWTCWCEKLWRVSQWSDGDKKWERFEMTQPKDERPARVTPDQVEALNDMVSLISEMVVGYRKRLTDGGIPAEVADAMALEFHHMVMEQTKEGVRQGAAQQRLRGR
jgi:hypothetical protein